MQYANIDKHNQASTIGAHAGVSRRERHKKKQGRKVLLFFVLLVVAFGIFNFLPFLGSFARLVISSPKQVFTVIANKEPDLKQTNGRVNILILGTGGGTHEGPDLTDTIIVASIDVKTGEPVLFSFPRDVYVAQEQSKINALYAFATPKNQRLTQTMETIGEIVGLPIHYGIRVDFDGFTKAINLVGGITVPVENTFDDYQYPILEKEHDTCGYIEKVEELPVESASPSALPSPLPVSGQAKASSSAKPSPTSKNSPTPLATPKATSVRTHIVYINQATGSKINEEDVTEKNNPYSCRFEHIHFDKGTTVMNGTTALKYVRSRHGNNSEGSDFARSRRQQLVISAFKDALTSKETLFDLPKIQGLLKTFGESIDTNINSSQLADFYQLYKRVKQHQLRTIALTDGSDNGEAVFFHPPLEEYGGQWVLVPKGSDWTTVQQAIQRLLITPSPSVLPSATP